MAIKPEFILQFEKASGISLKQVPFKEINKKERMINRAFSVDADNKITALSLDYIPQFLWNNIPFEKLEYLQFLSIRSCTLSDFQFLKDLKGLTSLDLSLNNIQDISFLSDLKGLTSLDLRNNQIQDISFLSDLKGLTSLDLSLNK
ncbi:MAG: hypothetical protein HN778_18340, partial [Prolixibacteraceae bacterium]|nr:hypothetical protein [Prolixibacteraceae bacterium]